MISVWATDWSNAMVNLTSGKSFSFEVDVTGASSVAPRSDHAPSAGIFASSAVFPKVHLLKSDFRSYSSQNVLFCAKASQSACQDADWSVTPCEFSKGCTIENNVLKHAAASAFGTYALCSPTCTLPPQQQQPPSRPEIPNPPNPYHPPGPGSGPGVTLPSTSAPSPETFPLWAMIFIPVAGGVALLSMGGFFAYRRVVAVRTRAKQIVAASAWKSFANVITIPNPVASLATSTNPVVNGPDAGSLMTISQITVVSSPTTPVTPSATSKLTKMSSAASRRQELADIAAS
jgi:hypothetical protein